MAASTTTTTTTTTTTSGATPATRAPTGVLASVIATARPPQWIKNVLVFAAPVAGAALVPGLTRSAAAFAVFCVAASGGYLLNDAQDVAEDRAHPSKRLRPVAAGRLGVATARRLGMILMAVAVLAAAPVSLSLAGVVAGYVVLTTSYSRWLKQVAVLDLIMIGAGFVLRVLAGAVAAGVALSGCAIAVTAFGALFMATGKRDSERRATGGCGPRRITLTAYAPLVTSLLATLAGLGAVAAYGLWANQLQAVDRSDPWFIASVPIFGLAIARYGAQIIRGRAERPEDVILHDHVLQAIGVAWAVLFLLGVYA